MTDVLVIQPGEQEPLGRSLLKAAQDGLTILEYTLEGGGESGGLHHHKSNIDAFFVLEGELEFRLADRVVPAGPGTLVMAPPGAVHSFPRALTPKARFLNLHAPSFGDAVLPPGAVGKVRTVIARRPAGREDS